MKCRKECKPSSVTLVAAIAQTSRPHRCRSLSVTGRIDRGVCCVLCAVLGLDAQRNQLTHPSSKLNTYTERRLHLGSQSLLLPLPLPLSSIFWDRTGRRLRAHDCFSPTSPSLKPLPSSQVCVIKTGLADCMLTVYLGGRQGEGKRRTKQTCDSLLYIKCCPSDPQRPSSVHPTNHDSSSKQAPGASSSRHRHG